MNICATFFFVIVTTLASSSHGYLRSTFPSSILRQVQWPEITKKTIEISVGVITSSVIGLTFPDFALAVSGASAKQEFFKAEDTSSTGDMIYNEAELKVVKEKLQRVEEKWSSMMTSVSDLSKKGSNRGDRMEIQSILGRDMTDLKVDMRRVSKVACGGDILVRGNAQDAAQFDYNSGKFAYKPLPQQAENVIGQINEVYFNGVKAEPAVLDAEIDKANRLFGEWLTLTKSTLGK